MEVQIKAGAYLLLTRQFEDAKSRVQRVLDRDPKNVQALVIVGNASAGLRDLDSAVADIEQAIEIDPSRSTSYTNLAALRLAQGQRDAARAAFEKAISVDPRSVPAHVAFAMFQWGNGDRAAAEQSFKTALTLDPRHLLANRALASYYIGTNRAAEAEPYLKTVAAVGGDNEKLMLGDYYLRAGRLPDARLVFNTVLSGIATPRRPQLKSASPKLLTSKNAPPTPTPRSTKCWRVNRLTVRALTVKARWLLVEQQTGQALKHATAATIADPESAPAHYLLGQAQVAVRDLDAAQKSFTEVLRLNPRAVAAQLQLSAATLARGETDAAVQFAREASKAFPVARPPG